MARDGRPHPLREVVLSEPLVRWQADFAAIAERLRDALGPLALRVEHIGSTSIPGLAAKDVIDVQVSVAELSDQVACALRRAGFAAPFGTDRVRDHVPAGWADDASAWDKQYFGLRGRERDANVHVRVAGAPNERYALLFRDYLRADDEARAGWEQVKRRLAAELPDRDAYALAKDPLTDELMRAAEAWAAATGWRP